MAFYDKQLETLDRDGLRDRQQRRLGELMEAVRESAFHRDKLASADIDTARVPRLEAFHEFPLTTKAELVEEQRLHPPFGRLLTRSRSAYTRFHRTSGTSGQPLLWMEDKDDWQHTLRCWGYVYRGIDISENDTILHLFSFGPYLSHWSAFEGADAIGALCVSGGGQSSEQRLASLVSNACTAAVSTPTYALHLAEVAERIGIDLKNAPVKKTIHAGEPGASIENVRNRIESSWGVRAFDHAGATEVGPWGFDCLADDYSIHLNELEFIFEILNPETLEPVVDGERGELVITSLGRLGMPVVRYRTGDLVEPVFDRCDCGRELTRIRHGVLGRADDMLIVRGVNIYPAAVDNIVRSFPEIGEYEVEIRTVSGMHELLVKCELAPGCEAVALARALKAKAHSALGIRIDVDPAETGSLPRYELKAKRYKHVETST